MSICADYGFWKWKLGDRSHCNCWTQKKLFRTVLLAQDCVHGIIRIHGPSCSRPALPCGALQKRCVMRVLLRRTLLVPLPVCASRAWRKRSAEPPVALSDFVPGASLIHMLHQLLFLFFKFLKSWRSFWFILALCGNTFSSDGLFHSWWFLKLLSKVVLNWEQFSAVGIFHAVCLSAEVLSFGSPTLMKFINVSYLTRQMLLLCFPFKSLMHRFLPCKRNWFV